MTLPQVDDIWVHSNSNTEVVITKVTDTTIQFAVLPRFYRAMESFGNIDNYVEEKSVGNFLSNYVIKKGKEMNGKTLSVTYTLVIPTPTTMKELRELSNVPDDARIVASENHVKGCCVTILWDAPFA